MAVSTSSAFGGTWFCRDHVVETQDVPPPDRSRGHGSGDVALRSSAKRAEGAGALSVVEQLGVADLAQGLAEARQLWQDWVEQDPRLASAPAVYGLQEWLMLV